MGTFLRVNLHVTKGNSHWNHFVSLDEGIEEKNLDFFFWIREHLKQRGLELENLDPTRASDKIWHWSPQSARELFSDRVVLAGFKPRLFSYHSLRAGFLCSALLKANTPEKLENALERTAFIAGWRPRGTS